ncbi:MAG TPA: hypothetical protein VE992_00010 [Solirubrobacteraceae bacterium]|nr:hypothetical protein [Solirubrobacteraceae bacterium]
MTGPELTAARWERLLERSNEFTCYSAAMATWLAADDDGWAAAVNPGLWLRLTEEPDGLFGFAYFPPGLRARLGLERAGADEPGAALEGVLGELERSGRVIVAADGYHLPWHVASNREHLPHWFTLTGRPGALEIADPFACRNELGTQTAERRPVEEAELVQMLPALPGTNPVHRLREELAFGDRTERALEHRHQWFVQAAVAPGVAPAGAEGPEAIRRLAAHFRERGQDPSAYVQADDIWSIARHRAFLLREAQARAQAAGDAGGAADAWAAEHGAPLARKWGHVAPLLMQATLSLRAGRAASSSVPDTLDALADMERAAAVAAAQSSFTI